MADTFRANGDQCLFLGRLEPKELATRLLRAGHEWRVLQNEEREDCALKAALALAPTTSFLPTIVLDGYHLPRHTLGLIGTLPCRWMWIDDCGGATLPVDLVLNQNLGATINDYDDATPKTQFLLGPRHVLLRPEFIPWRDHPRDIPLLARRLLVTFGGSDPACMTEKVMKAVKERDVFPGRIRIVTGPANSRKTDLHTIAGQDDRIEILTQTDMPKEMADADLAVGAGGTSAWEMAFMGLPMILSAVADNQRTNTAGLALSGIAVDAGWHAGVSPHDLAETIQSLAHSPERRQAMSRNGRALIDGHGPRRVRQALCGIHLQFRPAGPNDCRRVWEWSNDPAVRAASFTPDPIPWEQHEAWFRSRIESSETRFWIVETDLGHPVSQVRIERGESGWVISLSLINTFRKKGLGAAIIRKATDRFFAETQAGQINAYIKQDNAASCRSFFEAGYQPVGTIQMRGQAAQHWIYPGRTL